jgi:hypothetical protein
VFVPLEVPENVPDCVASDPNPINVLNVDAADSASVLI